MIVSSTRVVEIKSVYERIHTTLFSDDLAPHTFSLSLVGVSRSCKQLLMLILLVVFFLKFLYGLSLSLV